MSDQTLKIVQSPVVTDVQLPLPVHFNGLDQPILDDYALATDYVKIAGDTMTGRLFVGVIQSDTFSADEAVAAVKITPEFSNGYTPSGSATPHLVALSVDQTFDGSPVSGFEFIDIGIGINTGT